MKLAKTQPTLEEQCCPKCGSANFWVESPTEGIAARRIEDATVYNQDHLVCYRCHYECAGVVFSATLAKRRKAMAPVPIGGLDPMPAALAYGSTPAPKPIFRHGKKHNHRCTKAAQKKARRRARA